MQLSSRAVEKELSDAADTLEQGIAYFLTEVSFENYRYVQEFSEAAKWHITELSMKLPVEWRFFLEGLGAPDERYLRLMVDIEFLSKLALESRERQRGGLESAWFHLHLTATILHLLLMLLSARFGFRSLPLPSNHRINSLCDRATDVFTALIDFSNGTASFYQLVRVLEMK